MSNNPADLSQLSLNFGPNVTDTDTENHAQFVVTDVILP